MLVEDLFGILQGGALRRGDYLPGHDLGKWFGGIVLKEQIAAGDKSEIRIDEIRIGEGSKLCGTTLRNSPIKSKLGLIVVGLQGTDGEMRFNPGADEELSSGDIIIVIGEPDKLSTLRELTVSPAGAAVVG